jgi:multiple sugar transport system ATP-binding protein
LTLKQAKTLYLDLVEAMSLVELKSIFKNFGKTRALEDISFKAEDKEFFCIVGPTNAGKTTILRSIAGLTSPDSGDIYLDGIRANDIPPYQRNVAMLFQNLALYPNKSAFENIATPLRIQKEGKAEIKRRVYEIAEVLHITHILDRLPKTYSGGERQRVALGRTMIRRPKVYLFDEPLSNLDALLRVEMRTELKRLQRDLGQTMIYVTHDQVEALSMSDHVLVLNKGTIQQVGDPLTVFNNPENMFTAGLFGIPPMSFIRCALNKRGDRLFCESSKIRIDVTSKARELSSRTSVIIGVRPQQVGVSKDVHSEHPFFRVEAIESIGSKKVLSFMINEDVLLIMVPDHYSAKIGDSLGIVMDFDSIYFFDEMTRRVIT